MFFPLIALFFLLFAVPWITGTLTGWKRLASVYPCTGRFPEDGVWHRISVPNLTLRNFLTVGVNEKGMFFAWPIWFRIGNPPVHVPWDEIRIENSKIIFKRTVKVGFNQSDTSLHFYPEDAAAFKRAAGGKWPGPPPLEP